MISFSTGELRRKNTVLELRNILGQNWENKLVKTSDEFVRNKSHEKSYHEKAFA